MKDGSVFSGTPLKNMLGDVVSECEAQICYNHFSTLKEAIVEQ